MGLRTTLPVLVALVVPHVTGAQGVTIAKARPTDVVEALKAQLLPQGFQFVRADDKSALFTLDRGMVSQHAEPFRGALVHIVLEFTVRFRQKDAGLQVMASEEVVGNPRASTQFRKPVTSQAERASMQQLLDAIRADLEARPVADSVAKRDSVRP
jgi:hypothetical protein